MIKLPENFLRIFARVTISTAVICMIIFFVSRLYNSKCLISTSCEPIYFSTLIPSFNKSKFDQVKFTVNIKIINRYRDLDLETENRTIIIRGSQLQNIAFKVKNNYSNKSVKYKLALKVGKGIENYLNSYNCCNHTRKIRPNEEQINKFIFKVDEEFIKHFYENNINLQEQDIYFEIIQI